ncbi:MAG: WYL domain-containing protein [Candidatus Obscuribacterales bacterium]|nr:WYL domain-containing protein [Candidatus Obscuribacterales bacterium]
MSRLERLIAMEEEIRRGRYPNVDTFCRMFEIQPRTVYADIRELKERLGLEIEFDRFRNGYFNKDLKKQLPQFELSDGEVFALTVGKEMLSQYTGTAFEPILKAALEKISLRLPDRVKIDLEDVRGMISFSAGSVIQVSRRLMLDLYRACEYNLSLDTQYYTASRGELTERRIDPYRILENRGTWYVVAYCHWRKGVRVLAMHRIKKYELTEDRFDPIHKTQVEEMLKATVFLEHSEKEHRVTIRFCPEAARYIRERNWHSSQELEEHQDGSCTLSFTTTSLDETKRWVLTYGAQAQVEAPVQLIEMMQDELERALMHYKQTAGKAC